MEEMVGLKQLVAIEKMMSECEKHDHIIFFLAGSVTEDGEELRSIVMV